MKIFIITETKYPSPSAVTTHLSLVANILLEGGHDVTVYGRGMTEKGEYNNIPFISFRGKSENTVKKVFDYCHSFKKSFLKEVDEKKPDAILMYAIPLSLTRKLISKSRRGEFVLINDCVEWYSKSEFKLLSPQIIQYYVHEHRMKRLLPGNVNVIAISRYLEQYFCFKGNNTVYLPAVCDTAAVTSFKNTDKSKITIVYAGTPAKKDLFEPIVNAIAQMSFEERQRLNFKIIGSSLEDIAENANVSLDFIKQLSDCISFLPRMSHLEVLKQFETADFSILIRPSNMRYANAGFPTKVPESLSTGTPIICNYTSDLESYLKDGDNAIISDGFDCENVLRALRRAMALTSSQREQMYLNARKTAEEKFDYRCYIKSLNDFINKLKCV